MSGNIHLKNHQGSALTINKNNRNINKKYNQKRKYINIKYNKVTLLIAANIINFKREENIIKKIKKMSL